MADELGEPVELFRARGPVDAAALYDMLWRAGLPVRLDDEPIAADDATVRVLVGRAYQDAAQVVLAEFLADNHPPAPAPAADRDPPAAALAVPAPDPPVRAEWGEVAAVLAVGVLPNLSNAVSSLLVSTPGAPRPIPNWQLADAVQLTGVTGCAAFVTLYLIRRSGEPWARFGLGPVRVSDVPLGIGMLLVALAIGFCTAYPGPSGYWPPGPRGPTEAVLMVVKLGVAGFSEELVTRGYLITRLEVLLRSRGKAVVLAAAAFASYHAYQGAVGVVYTFAFGLTFGAVYLGVRRVWPLALGHALYNILLEIAAGPGSGPWPGPG
jgi:membrane protease YdiL (CAAX protease family)